MTDPIALIVLVAAGEASNPTTIAMARATGDALGGVPVEVREIPAQPTDADALAAEQQTHADAIVELIWEDAERRRVTLRVHLAASRRWVERSIGFMPSDPAAERGRTLGFAAASILPEAARSPERGDTGGPVPPAPAPPPGTAPGPSEGGASLAVAHPEAASVVPPPTAPNGPTTAEAPNGPRLPRRVRVEIDLLATGDFGIAGNADGAGGGGAVGWVATEAFTMRIGASERAGSLNIAQATLFTLFLDAGVTWHPWRATRSRPLGLSVRADYLLVRQSATHLDSDDPAPVTASRWLSGADAVLDLTWAFSTEVEAILGVGLEDLLSPTYVNVRDVRVATLPALRAIGEAGFRLRF